MPTSLHIQVFDQQQLLFADQLTGPIELGRQRQKEQSSYRPVREADRWRLSIARTDEPDVSRRHALIEPLAMGRVRITNLSEVQSISFEGGEEIPPKHPPRELALPVAIRLGTRRIQVDAVEEEADEFQSLGTKMIVPGNAAAPTVPSIALLSQPDKLDLVEVLSWMQTAVSVLQSAVSSSEFFEKAAKAALELVGLDSGQVLLLENKEWKAIASCPPAPPARAAL